MAYLFHGMHKTLPIETILLRHFKHSTRIFLARFGARIFYRVNLLGTAVLGKLYQAINLVPEY